MTFTFYEAGIPVRNDISDSHNRYWTRLSKPGNWFSAAQRIAIAEAVREAQSCKFCCDSAEALSPNVVQGTHTSSVDLPMLVVDTIHRIVTDASRLSSSWYHKQLESGLTEGQYIEIVGTVVAVISIDTFSDALGVDREPLPQPVAGEPSGYTPTSAATSDQAWVPMLDPDNEGTPEADLWPPNRTGNVVRAMSLVPDEVRTLIDLSAAHYLPMPLVRQAGVDAGRALSRSQMELLAGRVSALNQCYY